MSGLIHYLDGHKIKVNNGFFHKLRFFLQTFELTIFSLNDREFFVIQNPNVVYDTLSRDHEQIPFVLVLIKSSNMHLIIFCPIAPPTGL